MQSQLHHSVDRYTFDAVPIAQRHWSVHSLCRKEFPLQSFVRNVTNRTFVDLHFSFEPPRFPSASGSGSGAEFLGGEIFQEWNRPTWKLWNYGFKRDDMQEISLEWPSLTPGSQRAYQLVCWRKAVCSIQSRPPRGLPKELFTSISQARKLSDMPSWREIVAARLAVSGCVRCTPEGPDRKPFLAIYEATPSWQKRSGCEVVECRDGNIVG
jgi:hypothetical protein